MRLVPFATILALLAASCSAAVGPTPTSLDQPSGSPAAAEAAVVTLTGGLDAGRRVGKGDPNCTVGLVGPQGWGVQLTIDDAQPNELASLQIVAAAPGREDDPNATFPGTKFLMAVVIGPFFAASRRSYEITVMTDPAASVGDGAATIADNGVSAEIHATGTTPEGVSVDARVFCASVQRM